MHFEFHFHFVVSRDFLGDAVKIKMLKSSSATKTNPAGFQREGGVRASPADLKSVSSSGCTSKVNFFLNVKFVRELFFF